METVVLSEYPERTVTIPLMTRAGPRTDYSGVPLSVTFNAGDGEDLHRGL